MRARFVSNFVNTIRTYDWDKFIDSPGSVNDKTVIFQTVLENAFRKAIPRRLVPNSKKDKPWITPYLKNLIHDRWSAYRSRDFNRYKSLSNLIKRKISEAKSLGQNVVVNHPIFGAKFILYLVLSNLIL